jgi:hypothetical protein
MPASNSLPLEPPFIFGASVVGASHIKSNLPCQDAAAYEVLVSGFAVFAIADGLGSAAKSDLGAKAAVGAALAEVREMVAGEITQKSGIEDMARSAVVAARKELEQTAREAGLTLSDLACTLMVGVILADSVCIAHIGDGAAVAKSADGLKIVSSPAESEYVNEVVPLTAENFEKEVRVSGAQTGVKAVAAFTDGCQRGALKKSAGGFSPHDKFFDPLFVYAMDEVVDLARAENEIRGLLASDKLGKISDDDKTLVVAVLKKG